MGFFNLGCQCVEISVLHFHLLVFNLISCENLREFTNPSHNYFPPFGLGVCGVGRSHRHSLSVMGGVLTVALHFFRDPETFPGKQAPQLAV